MGCRESSPPVSPIKITKEVQEPSPMKIHVIVIGQGDAILLETKGRLL